MSLRDSKGTPEPVRRLLDCLTSLPGIGGGNKGIFAPGNRTENNTGLDDIHNIL